MAKYYGITVTPSSGLTYVSNEVLEDTDTVKRYKFKFTAVTTGTQSIDFSYDNGAVKTKTTTVRPLPTVISSITVSPATLTVGEDGLVTVLFDKELTASQSAPSMQVDAGLMVKVPFALNGTRTGGTMTVTALTAGVQQIRGILAAQTTTRNVLVSDTSAHLVAVTANPSVVYQTQDVTITASFDKVPVLSKATFTPDPGMQLKTAPTVQGNSIVAVYTITTALGAVSVDFAYEGETPMSADFTANGVPIVKTLTVDPASGWVVGDNINLEVEFNVAQTDLTGITFNIPAALTQVTAPTLEADGLSAYATYTATAAGSAAITVSSNEDASSLSANLLIGYPNTFSGTITTDAVDYDLGDTVELTIPFNQLSGIAGGSLTTANVDTFVTLNVPATWSVVSALAVTGSNITASYKVNGVSGTAVVTATNTYDQSTASVNVVVNPLIVTASLSANTVAIGSQLTLTAVFSQDVDVTVIENNALNTGAMVGLRGYQGTVEGLTAGSASIQIHAELVSDSTIYEETTLNFAVTE